MTHKIAIIGAGSVGSALARGFAAAGHDVRVGVRQPDADRYDDLRANVEIARVDDAVRVASIVMLAVPAETLEDLVPSLDLSAGHIVVDATNAVVTPIPDGFDSLGEYVGSLLPPGVLLVKAFDTVGAEHLGGGTFDRPTFLPIAGDEAGVLVVTSLAEELGFDVADLGGRESIGLVEANARLWIHLAFRRGWGRDFAWSVVRR